MSGFITKVEVEANAPYIMETWGIVFYLVCLQSEGETFLSVLVKEGKI